MVIVIPRLQGQTVQTEALPSARYSTSVPAAGAAVGAGIIALGVGVNEADQKASEVSVMNAETQYRTAIDDVLSGPQNAPGSGYLYSDGPTALARSDAVTQRIREVGDSITAALPDDQARAAFALHRDRLFLGAREDIQGHVAQAGNEFKDQSQYQSQAAFVRTGVSKVMSGAVKYGQTPSLPAAAQGLIPEGNTQGPMITNDRSLVETLDVAHLSWRAYVAQNAGRFGGGADMTDEGLRQIDSTFWAQAIRAALTPGPNQDDQLAKALYDAHKDQISVDPVPARGGMPGVSGDLTRESIQNDVERAYAIGESQRQGGAAWAGAQGETINDRRVAALAAIPKGLDAETAAGARKVVETQADAAQKAQTADWNDQTQKLLDQVDKGAPAARVAMAATGLPVEHREAVAKALNNRSKQVVAQSQSDFYQEWSTKAAGKDPATGEVDPKMRDEFLAHNFIPDIPSASKDNWDHLRALQREGKSGGGKKTDSLVSDDDIAQHVTDLLNPDAKDRDRSAALYDIKRKLGNLWANERGDGPELTPAQKQKQADELTAQSVFDRAGWGGPTGGNLSILEALTADPTTLDVADIPDDQRKAAVDALHAAGIATPNHTQIARQYQLTIQAGLVNGLN